MRIRQIKPDFWSDKVLAGMEDTVRLFYIGLWMQADDDGFIRNDADRIAADLYPYKGVAGRERFVRSALLRLADSGHIRMLECDRHIVVPNLPRFQVVAATRRVVRVHGEHNAQCTANAAPSGNGDVGRGTGTERERGVLDASANGRTHESTVDELQRLLNDETSTAPAKKAARKALERLGITTGEAT